MDDNQIWLMDNNHILIGGLEHEFCFSIQLGMSYIYIIPTEELIFFRGVETTDDKIVEVKNQKLFSQDHGEAVSRKAARGRIFCSSTSP